MPHATLRRTAISAALLTSALLGACDMGGDGPRESADADPSTQGSSGAVPAPQTSTISIGLTGLILMLPVSNPAGTGLFMPKEAKDHVAYVGFEQGDGAGCDEYIDEFDICFMSLEKSSLKPIGVAPGTQGSASQHVVSVTRNSGGKKGEAPKVAAKSRARATLLSGSAKDPCALATWTIDPHGEELPEELIEPANVLTWEIPNFPGRQLVLERTRLSGGTLPDTTFTLQANQQGRIELLIVHVPKDEFTILLGAKPGPGPIGSPAPVDTAEINLHLAVLYDAIEVHKDQRVFPSDVTPKGDAMCPINVLGLQNATYPLPDPSAHELKPHSRDGIQTLLSSSVPRRIDGIRTYSCIIGSADS